MNRCGRLPAWRSVLAVIAHPDDESFGLGAILSSFADQGVQLAVLCMTHGEASTLRGVAGDLQDIRTRELTTAAEVLDVSTVELREYPDGHLVDTRAGNRHCRSSAFRNEPASLHWLHISFHLVDDLARLLTHGNPLVPVPLVLLGVLPNCGVV